MISPLRNGSSGETAHDGCPEFRQAPGWILQAVLSGSFFHKLPVLGHSDFQSCELIHHRFDEVAETDKRSPITSAACSPKDATKSLG